MATKKKTTQKKSRVVEAQIPLPQVDLEMLNSTFNTIIVRLNSLTQRVTNLEAQLKETAQTQARMQENLLSELGRVHHDMSQTVELVKESIQSKMEDAAKDSLVPHLSEVADDVENPN